MLQLLRIQHSHHLLRKQQPPLLSHLQQRKQLQLNHPSQSPKPSESIHQHLCPAAPHRRQSRTVSGLTSTSAGSWALLLSLLNKHSDLPIPAPSTTTSLNNTPSSSVLETPARPTSTALVLVTDSGGGSQSDKITLGVGISFGLLATGIRVGGLIISWKQQRWVFAYRRHRGEGTATRTPSLSSRVI